MYLVLFEIAKDDLAIPPTSAPAESLFSIMDDIIQRKGIDYCRSWQRCWPFSNTGWILRSYSSRQTRFAMKKCMSCWTTHKMRSWTRDWTIGWPEYKWSRWEARRSYAKQVLKYFGAHSLCVQSQSSWVVRQLSLSMLAFTLVFAQSSIDDSFSAAVLQLFCSWWAFPEFWLFSNIK